ncbi:MAG: NCS1 family nucleobase:cation symporter-1 [Elusimicrobia bacterium]|nr:NCS1 family nucleobase:cation symporter-1 [Elusimicrobiota bacterium]
MVELSEDVSVSPLYNPDIAPVGRGQRKWGAWDIAALWIGMSVCIPTYMLASSLISGGMNWWQAILTILLGNVIVLVPMTLNAHAGTKYGIPFPVCCRASFGAVGAHIPSVLRGLVACGWFGIQTWIGGWSIYKLLTVFFPYWDAAPAAFLGINAWQFACFMAFWALNMAVFLKGMEMIRRVEDWGAPLLILMGLGLLAWACVKAGGFGPMLSSPSQFAPGGAKEGRFWSFFFPALTGMVGFWATLSLNIPDFTRFARSQRDQMLGQALGLPTTMTLYSFIGVAVTSATVVIFGEAVWDPIVLLAKLSNPFLVILSMLALTLATLTTNIAANMVSPAVGFSNLSPKRISLKAGGAITGVIGIAIQPWRLVADPTGYIFTWLIGYSALLGAVAGVMLCDYFWIRRSELRLADLYREDGAYAYRSGVNPAAVAALALGILPCLPGFLATVKAAEFAPFWTNLYHYAWFVSFGVSFAAYGLLSRGPAGRPSVRGSRLFQPRGISL